jgi:hypothetical protein
LPFCHSLTLVSCGNGQYQIHNDAMALLTEWYIHETARNACASNLSKSWCSEKQQAQERFTERKKRVV